MTVRLYYEDAYRTGFTAQIVERRGVEDQHAVRLNRSAFYPTSGGQPHDIGYLNDTAVVDVQAGTDGAVMHLLAEPLPEETTGVVGEVDWTRRYDHMQQHSGQHLLSQIFFRLQGLETVGVHFGERLNTVDLEGDRLTEEALAAAEVRVNELIWQNRPVRAYWVTEAELGTVPLRRAPKVGGRVRIVEIDKFDWSACGGTHVRRTGEIGLISLLRVEKHRGRSRVHFVCGRRALADTVERRGLLAETAALLESSVQDVPGLVAKQQESLRAAEKETDALREALTRYEARALLEVAECAGGLRLAAKVLDDARPADLQRLARALIAGDGVVALLGCAQGEKGTVILARSGDLTLHAGDLLRDTVKQYDGGGGGRPDFAQGGTAAGRLADVLNAVKEAVRRGVGS